MKVHINLSKEYTEPQITILAAEANEDIQKLLSYIQNMEKVIAANEGESIIILKPEEIYMICSMGRGVNIYSEKKEYTSSKCLYEFENTSLFVTSGLGHYPLPLRFNNRPEICFITIKGE